MKYAGAHAFPHVSPGTQLGSTLEQSYMILFQSSPVETAKRRRKLVSNTVKFLYSLITSPYLTPLNMNWPRVARMKKKSIRSMNTLNSAEIDSIIVLNSD